MRSCQIVCSVMLVVIAACASSREVAPEELAAAEQRLLSPFKESRAIVCEDLVLDISANFDDEVARPARSPRLHSYRREVEDGDVVHRWTSRGGTQLPLRFVVGQVQLVALRSATLRIRGSGKSLALSATATGQVTEGRTGAELVDCQEISIKDGVFHRR